MWDDYAVPGGAFRENLYGLPGQTFLPDWLSSCFEVQIECTRTNSQWWGKRDKQVYSNRVKLFGAVEARAVNGLAAVNTAAITWVDHLKIIVSISNTRFCKSSLILIFSISAVLFTVDFEFFHMLFVVPKGTWTTPCPIFQKSQYNVIRRSPLYSNQFSIFATFAFRLGRPLNAPTSVRTTSSTPSKLIPS